VILDDYDSVHWTISEGTILSGQGTREITVDTSGLGGRKITATVEALVSEYEESEDKWLVELTMEDDPRPYSSSCTVQILGESRSVPRRAEQALGADSP